MFKANLAFLRIHFFHRIASKSKTFPFALSNGESSEPSRMQSQFHQHFRCAFCAIIFVPKITKPCFGFEFFWHQKYWGKSALKMLKKLKPVITKEISKVKEYW